jgi:poly-beta-1,6-N-acetyl-D-glucosamine biosynthesis protein PgaD
MKSLILDGFDDQPLPKRIFRGALTAGVWSFWIYLWSPLFTSIGLHMRGQEISPEGARLVQELSTTLGDHLSMVSVLIALFIAWAGLEHLGRSSPSPAGAAHRPPAIPSMALLTTPNPTDFSDWHLTQRVVVFHDERSGQIRNIKYI